MDLRRVRLRLTALNLLLFALGIGIVAALVVRAGAERIDNAEQREAQVALGRLLADRVNGGTDPPPDTWLVDLDEKRTTPLGDQRPVRPRPICHGFTLPDGDRVRT